MAVQIETARPRPAAGVARRFRPDIWTWAAFGVAAFTTAPILAVVVLALGSGVDVWRHLADTVLPHYVQQTLILMLGTGLGTFIIGTGTAWLTATCRFPGRRLFEWALLLPMAVPAYIIAYVYTDLLEYAGPVQSVLRELMGWASARDYSFPEIRSPGGAIAMMTLVLYPYVYLLARSAFLDQAGSILEAGRVLGRGPWRNFIYVALPLARPAIVVGVSLVCMEVLNDFGTVDFFAVQTFTAGIYDVWLNMNNPAGAAQLATALMVFVLLLLAAERIGRRHKRFDTKVRRLAGASTQDLPPVQAALAIAACGLPVLLGFAVPALVLGRYALRFGGGLSAGDLLSHSLNSLLLSGLAAVLAAALGLLMAYGVRLNGGRAVRGAARLASIGYAVPGAVLAVGVLLPLARFDNALDGLLRQSFGVSSGLLLSGTLFAVLYGFLARFMALSYGAAESGLARITPNMEGAARTLGANRWQVLKRVHVPLLRGSLLTGILLVFVDGMKELPMTMLLRPFNFETLATFVHQYASDELLEECSLAALAIVGAGILPVIALSRTISSRRGEAGP